MTFLGFTGSIQRRILEICLPGAEAAGALYWWEHLDFNFDKLLEAEYELV